MVDLDDLAAGLAEFADNKKKRTRSANEDRLISGFGEIINFVKDHGREPINSPDQEIFERLYAVRLQKIRSLPYAAELLSAMDSDSLLTCTSQSSESDLDGDSVDLEELSAALGEDFADKNLTELKHVRSAAEKRAAEEIASRAICEDFGNFESLFRTIRDEIKSGERLIAPFGKDATIEVGDLFVVDGLTAYVASVGEAFFNDGQDRYDARLRVIFSNKTESNLLRTSLQKALHKDGSSRRIARDCEDSLFSSMGTEIEDDDVTTGVIYVLRSNSPEDFIVANRELVHKVGVTEGKVETRISNAKNDPTFLLADVEIVQTYQLVGINPKKLENLIHKFLAPAKIEVEIKDRFGKPVKPREWFLVPLNIIDDIVGLIRSGQIVNYGYDPSIAKLYLRSEREAGAIENIWKGLIAEHQKKFGVEPNMIGLFRDPKAVMEGIEDAIAKNTPYDEYILLTEEQKKAWDEGSLVF